MPDLAVFWNIETIGISEDSEVSENEKAMSAFKESIEFKDGRYQVKWPWKADVPDLPSNRNLAMGHLKSMAVRMKNKPDLLKQYDSVI